MSNSNTLSLGSLTLEPFGSDRNLIGKIISILAANETLARDESTFTQSRIGASHYDNPFSIRIVAGFSIAEVYLDSAKSLPEYLVNNIVTAFNSMDERWRDVNGKVPNSVLSRPQSYVPIAQKPNEMYLRVMDGGLSQKVEQPAMPDRMYRVA